MKKKILSVLLILCMAVGVCACGKGGTKDDKITENSSVVGETPENNIVVEEEVIDETKEKAETLVAAIDMVEEIADFVEGKEENIVEEINCEELVKTYYMYETILDDEKAANIGQSNIKKIYKSGRGVKMTTLFCEFSGPDEIHIMPQVTSVNVEDDYWHAQTIELNEVEDVDDDKQYYLAVIICPEENTYMDFKINWEKYTSEENEYVEENFTKFIMPFDESIDLNSLENYRIYNIDGNFYNPRGKCYTIKNSTENGVTLGTIGLDMLLVQGDKSTFDFTKLNIETALDSAKDIFAGLNYVPRDRFANRDWLASEGKHPAMDTIMFDGEYSREMYEQYYLISVQWAEENNCEENDDLYITYTDATGKKIVLK